LIAITNASPLIYLGKLGRLHLLPKIFKEIYTTDHVKNEVLRIETAPEQVALEEAFNSWLISKKPQTNSLIEKLEQLNIHKGEASVLVLAKEFNLQGEKTIVILDDLATRDVARAMGFVITGTVGILIRSVKQKLISKNECRTILTHLTTETDFRMSIKLYSRIISDLERI
jgi:predicted nucleic acid-binding protein